MKIIFFGSSDFGLPSLETLLAAGGVEVAGVVSQPDRPVGRKHVATPTPVSEFALKHNLPLWRWPSLKNDQVVTTLQAQKVDFFVVAAYGLLLPPEILAIVPGRSINIHGSLLPKYRGATPVPAAILSGDSETGVTFMVMTPGLDEGPVLSQYTVPIKASDTTPSLLQKLAELSAQHIVPTLRDYMAGQIKPKPQPKEGVSLVQKLARTDGLATWDSAALEVRKIRAYDPWPGLWTTWNGQRLLLLAGHAEQATVSAAPGTVVPHAQGWAVACTEGLFVPERVHRDGRSPQPASALTKLPGFLGSRLG